MTRNSSLEDSNINRYIEIVTIPKRANSTTNRKNVGIELNEETIFNILSENYEKVLITIIKTEDDLKNLIERKPDLVFSGIKYFNFDKKEIWLSDYLKEHGIDYITSNKEALDNESNKQNAKDIVQKENIITANSFTTQPDEHPTESSLPVTFPLFLKPVAGANRIGINAESVVFDFNKYQAKVLDIFNTQKSRTLVENYLSGKEYSVSILENSSKNILMILPIEIVANKNRNGHRILDFDAKNDPLEELITISDKKLSKEICLLAINSFRALGGKTMGKIDIKMSYKGVPTFIEANFMPDLDEGYFYKSFMINENMNYEQMILKITDTALTPKAREE
jgi:D-alanine-D-alanine ligase